MTENLKAIRFPGKQQGNELYPLPPDYGRLSEDGKKLARLNACRLQETPEDFVTAWNFFRRTYLMPTPPGFFYGSDLVESPPIHYQMIGDVATYDYNLHGLPRGYSKSTLADEVQLLLALSRPRFPVALCLASDSLIGERFEIFQRQFEENEFILADWGSMKPSKGSGSWSQHILSLNNGSRMRGFPVQGRKRGTRPRPRLLILDDPEYDPTGSTDMTKLREDFDRLLFNVLLPMGQKGMALWWLGTVITKQGSLYRAFYGNDSRFERWNRVLLSAEVEVKKSDGEMTTEPLWAAMHDTEDLQLLRDTMGAAAFGAEYMNNPGVGSEATFQMDSVRHNYEVGEGGLEPEPLLSPTIITYRAKEKSSDEFKVHETPAYELFPAMYRMLLTDYAPTVSKHSDYSAIAVLGFQRPMDVLWVLDAFVGKVTDDTLMKTIWRLGQRWRPQVVGIEAVSLQQKLADSVGVYLDRMAELGPKTWYPKVVPIRYPYGVSKQDRISGLQWRFTSDRIKLPFARRNSGAMAMLFQQFENFRADARDGNLMHDDILDAVSMYQQVRRSRGGSPMESPREVSCPLDALIAGETNYKGTGMSPGMAINIQDVPNEVVMKLRMSHDFPEEKRDLSLNYAD